MARTYQPRYLPDGTLNPKYRPGGRGPKSKSKKSGSRSKHKKPCLFDTGNFVCIDGEGIDEESGKHIYNMLVASNGDYIADNRGLSTNDCFEFLAQLHDKNPRGIFAIFAGGYDANMWLSDVDKETLQKIVDADGKNFVTVGNYAVRFIARKYFALKRANSKKSMVIWDIYGFFQSSFVKAIENWLPGHPLLDQIRAGKEKRGNFKADDFDTTLAYCKAELEVMAQLCEKLREAIRDMNLKLSRWDGAGAIAAAMLQKHECKKAICDVQPEIQTAVQHAYFGGRIEIGKYGRHNDTVYHYDINSAYPAEQRHLPALTGGHWEHFPNGIDPRSYKNRLIVSRVRWSNIINTRFCPFPYRSEMQTKVLFPSDGENWIWKPELAAALDVREQQNRFYWNIEILECWVFYPSDESHKPFNFINHDYELRKQIVAESKRTGIPNGVEKTIKLGINSTYGKTAQKVGYNEKTGRKPPYHSLVYAGQITSQTRSMLWRAAMQADDKIICLATDGIYSQVPLTLDCPDDKILGAWEAQTHDEMILVQAGFYFLRDGEKWTCYSRGFDKVTTQEDIKEIKEVILDGWRKHHQKVYLPCTRFITLKTALRGDWFDRWRTWHKMQTEEDGKIYDGRALALTPDGTKRTRSETGRADNQMIQTDPEVNLFPEMMSMEYSLPWDELIENDLNETEINLEHAECNA